MSAATTQDFTNLVDQLQSRFHRSEVLQVTSDPSRGALRVSPDGHSFYVHLQQPIFIPINAQWPTIEVTQASVWHTVPNIVTGENDKFYLDFGGPFVLTIPEGNYDVFSLSDAIDEQAVLAGLPTGIISLSPNSPERKVRMTYGEIGVTVDFDDGTAPDNMRGILGFDSATLPASTAVGEFIQAPNVAAFNNVNEFLIHSDLNSTSLRFNDVHTDVIGRVPIGNTIPQDLITYEGTVQDHIHADNLIGKRLQDMRFYLTNETGVPANTGEFWSATITFRWWI
jgi:hypothetical protein